MKSNVQVYCPVADADWQSLPTSLNSGISNPLLESIFGRLRRLGCVSILVESAYIDRDFSATYAAFYAKLFKPLSKYCRRVHFFSCDVHPLASQADPAAVVQSLSEVSSQYLGDIVLRPLTHAPVSSARISAQALDNQAAQEIVVRSQFATHILGAEFPVQAMPVTQQDTRTGACAQAAMWMTGRHFHNRHGAPWFAMPDITDVALNPTDNQITRSLPAGSEYLTIDNMVRALRAMGRHPVTYVPDSADPQTGLPVWQNVRPKDVIQRYVDSGIPVILGLQQSGTTIGHAVVAVGLERTESKDLTAFPIAPTCSEYLTHLLVNDDQRGVYCRLPIETMDLNPAEYPFCLETDVKFLLVPLPEKVFMTAEVADLISRANLKQLSTIRAQLGQQALGHGSTWDVDPQFYDMVLKDKVVSRTYLTYGWKYKARMLRNLTSSEMRSELLEMQLPRYVWVTEFSLADEARPLDPCKRQIRAHSVIDATGSQFWDSNLIIDAPGLALFWQYDPSVMSSSPRLVVRASLHGSPYWPKIRGAIDYSMCSTM